MNLTLKVWRQKNAKESGSFATYQVSDISPDMSFLEMMDVLNEQLIAQGMSPSFLTTTAAKVFAELAQCSSTERPTAPTAA